LEILLITFCGFTARPAAQRTILIRILGRHFDAAVISYPCAIVPPPTERAVLSWCLSKAV
jgi:hypothetical protein